MIKIKKLGLVSLTMLVGLLFKSGIAHAGDLDTVYNDGTVVEFSMPESNQGEESMPAFQGNNSEVGTLIHDLPTGITPAGGEKSISSYSVIGSDGRVRINNTTTFPYSGVVYVYSAYPNGKGAWGTGNMVSRDTVLTAGHCIYSKSNGGWAKSVTVYPGLNGNTMPFGTADATSLMSVSGWIDNSSSEHDIGAIKLNRSIGDSTGWFGLTTTVPSSATLTGYPGDKPDFTMWSMSGGITKTTVNQLYYSIDTAGGQSGSGVYNSQKQIAAVHAYGFDGFGNSGTRINSEKFSIVSSWISGRNPSKFKIGDIIGFTEQATTWATGSALGADNQVREYRVSKFNDDGTIYVRTLDDAWGGNVRENDIAISKRSKKFKVGNAVKFNTTAKNWTSGKAIGTDNLAREYFVAKLYTDGTIYLRTSDNSWGGNVFEKDIILNTRLKMNDTVRFTNSKAIWSSGKPIGDDNLKRDYIVKWFNSDGTVYIVVPDNSWGGNVYYSDIAVKK